jgi:cytochrome c5
MTTGMPRRHIGSCVLAAALAASSGCGSTPAANAPASAPPAAAPGPATATTPIKVDMNAIFPPGSGRDLVLNNCQNCHTFVPIVVLQMEEDAWTRNSIDHRPRVTGLSDEDFKTLYDYLKANFNPKRPVPALPQELLDTWTGY